jgi:hypothetical protein
MDKEVGYCLASEAYPECMCICTAISDGIGTAGRELMIFAKLPSGRDCL